MKQNFVSKKQILKFLRRLLFSHLLLLFTSFTSAASQSSKCSNLSNKETTKPLVSFLLFCCCDKLWNNLCPHMFSHNLPSAWSWTPPRNRPEPPSSSSPTQLLDGLKIGWFKYSSHNSPIVHQSYMQFINYSCINLVIWTWFVRRIPDMKGIHWWYMWEKSVTHMWTYMERGKPKMCTCISEESFTIAKVLCYNCVWTM